ncbi:hypothetical protein [Streptomyces lavendulocolor]|uniref:hypothetical protein n=1 Tax=Streptomyces lavendulocolor TaxID=67316 RepID=UPI003C2C326B
MGGESEKGKELRRSCSWRGLSRAVVRQPWRQPAARLARSCAHRGAGTASAKWPQQRRLPLGTDGALGIAGYVIVVDADPPHIVLTPIQLY